ncbi:MAG: LAGLIDADG family homing endonuclease [Candidatus Paceibacterota bacterium]
MAKSSIKNRLKFSPGKQRAFILRAKKATGTTWKEMAEIIGVHDRTLRDWAREKHRISVTAAKKLAKVAKLKIANNVDVLIWKDHLKSAAKKGGQARYKKYGSIGDPEKRRKNWRKWWEETGKHQDNPILAPQAIKQPSHDDKLAEFVGIMLGDGGLTKYQATITLNSIADAGYVPFVSNLIKNLFEITPKQYSNSNSKAIDLVVHRVKLVKFCQVIGLTLEDKLAQGLHIPQWIQKKEKFQIACVRGLIDTDGSIYKHTYQVAGKEYSYPKIDFTTLSQQLRDQVMDILKNLHVEAKINYNGKSVRIENQAGVDKYMKVVGTNNPKHATQYGKLRTSSEG